MSRYLIAWALSAGLPMGGTAVAQDAAVAQNEEQAAQEQRTRVITGSRIKRFEPLEVSTANKRAAASTARVEPLDAELAQILEQARAAEERE